MISFAAAIEPGRVALDGVAGPVTFGAFGAQISATATVLAAQGLDSEIAVNAAVTGTLPVAELAPHEVAVRTAEAVSAIRAAALDVVGSDDLGSLPGILRSVTRRFGDRVAVTDLEGASLTYAELDRRSDELAAGLLAAGAGPETRVGVALPRTAGLIVALLATVKTGAAYLPLDSSHPIDRLQSVVDDAEPVLVLADTETLDRWTDLTAPLATVEQTAARATPETLDAIPDVVDGRHPAYVMYTSGSTGKPKGVVVTHADVVTLLWAMGQEYDYTPDDVWTMFQSYGFDVSVGEIWVALAFGGRLVVLDYLTTRTPDDFVTVLDREQVTVVNLTPSAFYQLAGALREPAPGKLSPSVRSMIFVGEALDFAQVRRWFDDRLRYDGNHGPELNNMYGPTEATVYMTRRVLTPEFVAATLASDVGAALPKSRMYVLDARLAKAPDGVPGDLYLAGDQLARGYAGRFALNATRFVADPYGAPGERMYQSGDVAIFRDGSLEFLGRADSQVKLRGYRIELGEVEAALESADGVNAAAATIAQREGYPDQLVGYVVGGMSDGSPLEVAAVKTAVAAKVPDYMVPDIVMVLDQLPLSVSGKLDRRALPKPVVESQVEYVAPENDVEEHLAEIVAEVLGLERVSVTESIFDLGGNSLLAAKIVGRACEVLGVDVNMRDVFAEPTVRGLAAKVGEMGAALPPLTAAAERPERLPLSFAQERMWFINRFEPEAPTYNVPALLRVTGALDLAALRAAVDDVVARHEVLRTTFPAVDGIAMQQIAPASEIADRLDWRVTATEAEFVAAAGEGFDVTAQWPLRVLVRQTAPGEHVVGVIAHHIAADGESMLPLVGDLVAAYTARQAGVAPGFAPLAVQFADFALWQRDAFGSPDDPASVLGRQLGYWRDRLRGLPEVLDLPADRPRPAVASHRGAQVEFGVPATVADRLTRLARELDATPFMVMHAALAVLLARLSATDDIAIATPIAGRGQAALDPLVGMFVNTLVLRARVDPATTFSDLVAQVRTDDLDAFANSDIPFEALVQDLNPVRSEAFSPLAQVMLSFDPAASASTAGFEVGGLSIAPVPPPVVPAQVDLTVTVATAPESQPWSGTLIYATDLFDTATAELFADRLVRLLGEVVENAETPVGDVPFVRGDETSRLLADSVGPVVEVPVETVADAVAARVAATPEAEAVRFEGRSLSYAEFGARVAVLARELIARGIGPETAVGVCMDRGVELVVAVHAITAAGGRYVPIGTELPADRAQYMLETAGASLVLVAAGSAPAPLTGITGVEAVAVDADAEADPSTPAVSDAERRGRLTGDSALYTLFTSGSTGVPKGVTVSHCSVLNRLSWGLAAFPWAAGDRVILKTPYTFDVSVPELYGPLIGGATVIVAREEGHRDPRYIANLILESEATSVHFVPSMLAVFLDVVERDTLAGMRSLKWLFASGEALPAAAVAAAHDVWPWIGIHNLFGPTEAAVEVGWADVSDAPETVTIGVPVWNTSMLVLDARLRPTPIGVPGELYLGGVQVARGYAKQPVLTAERFVADPFGSPGTRLYRTGDLVRRTVGGEIEYLGRTDFQVKLRGQRVELGEIEAVLAAAPGVVHAAASVVTAPAGGEFLVAYVSPATVDPAAVEASVARALPDYMRPTVWTLVEEMALNTAGKIDRKALPAPEFGATESEYTAPEGEVEETLAEVFADVLGAERVSATESFFDAGGNSLSAMRLVARAGDALGVELSVRDLFDAPTVRELAATSTGGAAALAPIVAVDPRPERIPLSYSQQRMWFINRLDPSSATYNIPALLRLTGDLDVDVLRAAAVDVVSRHEILRTTFPSIDGQPYQAVDPISAVDERLDWGIVDSTDRLGADLRRGFDVAQEWPVRIRLARTGPDEALLAVVVHHIAFDGQSFGPFALDLFAAYSARVDGATPRFAELPVQFADYAIWQRDVLGDPSDEASVLGRELAYWKNALAGVPDVLDLPSDRPRPTTASHRGQLHTFTVPSDVAALVDRIAARSGATRFMVLHAAFAVLLARLSANDDIVIGTPVGGRGRRELDGLVGMFVNTLALRTRIDPASSFTTLLNDVRDRDLTAFDHAQVPFESVVDAVNPVRSEAFSPIVQVILSVDPVAASTEAVAVGGLQVAPVEIAEAPAQMDLNLTVTTAGDGADWAAILTFATDLFDRASMETLSDRFVRVLRETASAPETALGDLPLMPGDETTAVLKESTGAEAPMPDETIADAVAASIARAPETTALVSGARELSYREFGVRVGDLARRLTEAGVGPDTAVGVVMDRGVELVIAVHAIMAAGGRYVPIDSDAPEARAKYMAETAGMRLVVVQAGAAQPSFLPALDVPVLEVDASTVLDDDARPFTAEERLAPSRVDDAAYTLFTSGSTGLPKGVTVSHGAVRNFVSWFDELVPAGEQRLLFKTPHTFDASVLELFWPLVAGQTMVVAEAQGHRDPRYMADVMRDAGVSVVQFVPSLLAAFLDVVDDEPLLPNLRVLFSGGEALPPAVAKDFRARVPQARLVNLFGPTEAAVYTMSAELLPPVGQGEARVGTLDLVPIGGPMANTTALVLDSRLHPVPDGVAGELYLGGVQSARGYQSRPILTAERFVADPFGRPGARMYRTGDLVRRSEHSGELEYLGRTDFQVKLRGQRMELGEIESAIASAPGVVLAAVRLVSGPAGHRLVGYMVPESVDTTEVAAAVSAALPEYMVPTVWMALPEMPVNTAGKVDRRALPDPDFEVLEYVAPANDDEQVVADVYADLLGMDRVSVTESFFDVGGNSLAAMRVVARVSDALGVQVSVRDVFDAPSVRELVAAVAGRAPALPPVVAVVPRPGQVPLSFAQQRMWFINRLDPVSPVYNVPTVLRVRGGLDVEALHAALVDVVVRHEVLRTVFPDRDGVPAQSVAQTSSVAARLDWAVVGSRAEVEAAVMAGFDLVSEWPIRVRVWEVASDEHVLAVITHHIASDGESQLPLVTDLLTAYSARVEDRVPEFAPLPLQFADFAIWQHEVLGSPEDPSSVVGRQLGYWTEQLAGLPDVLSLPADRPRPSSASHEGHQVDFEIPRDIAERVEAVAERFGVTPFMVVHAVLSVLLSRLSATDDVAVATPIAGRGQAELDRLIGMFVNTLVLRARVDSSMSFVDLLGQVRKTDLDAFAHADVPFEAVVDAVDPVRSEAFAPLAQVLLSFDPGASARDVDVAVAGLEFSAVESEQVPAQLDLYITVSTTADQVWSGSIVYATDLFDASTVELFAARLVAVLDGVTVDPSVAVGDVDLLAPEDVAAESAWEWGSERSLPGFVSVGDVLAAQVARTPDARALVFGERVVSYGEFGARVNGFARELIAAGVGPDVAVAVAVPRSVEMMVAVHAVVAAGGQYVPVDLGTPADRVKYMFETAQVKLMLVSDRGVAVEALSAAEAVGVPVLGVDASGEIDVAAAGCAPISVGERRGRLTGDSAVYTLFTSGSTGMPKGVTLSHGAVLNRLWWGLDELPIDGSDVVVQKTPFTFDCSVPELFAPLMVGAALVVLRQGGHLEPVYVASEIVRTGATMVHFVPSMLSVFLDVVPRELLASLTSVRIVSATGEALPPAVAAPAREVWPDALFYNLYGPTEAAVEITYQSIGEVRAEDSTVPIGVPVWNSSAVVLDSRLQRVPVGVPGELYLGGVQLARGYAGRPDLTAERFVADPHSVSGARLYRTGDLVRRLSGGVLEYLGRTDFQIKLRGQRIELGEIEAVLAAAPGVVHTAVTVASSPDGGEHLVGYVCAGPGESLDVEAVKVSVAGALPGYMVPTVWMVVDDIALNTAGKIDRKALPVPEFGSLEAEYVAPESEVEEKLAAVFADVLGVDRVSVTESFFDAGGNSLSAMRLVARAGEALGVELNVRDLFDAPTVRELVVASVGKSEALPPVVAVVPRPERVPLSFAQQRMWFINQFEPLSATYNIPVAVHVTGEVNVDAMRQAAVDVVRRQEILRTVFPAVDGRPTQVVRSADSADAELDWALADSEAELFTAASTGFDVTARPPLRVRMWQQRPNEWVLLAVIHHIVGDGESMLPLMTDMVSAYIARAGGSEPGFAPLPVQFADYAIWQHEVLGDPTDPTTVAGKQLTYWEKALAGIPDVLELPADRPRPPVATYAGARYDFALPAELGERIEELARTCGATAFMVVHAALSVLLARLSAIDDITVATPIAGRGQAELDGLVGMFVNTLVLRAQIDVADGFDAVVDAVRSTDLEAFAHADVPFETIVERLNPVRSQAFSPLAQVMLSVNHAAPRPSGIVEVDGLSVAPLEVPTTTAQLDLAFTVNAVSGETWPVSIVYATDLFDEGTVVRLGERFTAVLEAVTRSPQKPVAVAELVSETERAEIAMWSRGAPATGDAQTLSEVIE
ncbi:MAG: amino acid adenylation domain-containing protein [Gordonia sp. (in: high G+C Gram-positive bacteria)]